MQVTTRVILWITLIHFFVFTIVFTYYKTDSLHSYKTGKIQGLNAGDSQENRLLAEIAFKNLEAFEDKDILRELDAYANIEYFNFVEYQQDWNYVPGFKFAKNPDYCYKVDWYNLKNFDNIFTEQNFFTDYHEGYVRTEVIDKVGEVHMTHFKSTNEEFRIDYKINNFFVNSTEFHFDHFIGKDFLCSTQMYNRIPGNEFLTRKDLGLDRFLEYSAKYNERKQCGLPSAPKSYRLYHADECKAFFGIINSPEYITSSKSNPIQYLTKVGYNSHESTGVELFTENQRAQLRNAFHGGLECGVFEAALIAQSYISNPLLLNLNNKFDLKVYMLIASVNPLIVYYHDGYLRAAMKEYDIESIDEGVHLVNPQLIRKQIQEIHEWNANDISVEELIEYHLWNFQDFEDFLFDTGKIANKGWLENILKPDLKRAMIHLTKMVKDELLKEPNVYHLLELDFMLDADLNLWYIEANSHPQLHQESPKVAKMITEMLLDLFDIQYAYYRARMKRLVGVLAMIERDMKDNGYVDFASWQGEYRRAVKNHFDPEYPIKENNSFELIMDENKKGVDAYLGLLSEECI